MNRTFKTVEEITSNFIEDGWNKNISFTEVSLEEVKEKGCFSIVYSIKKGHKYFKMAVSGNIFDEKGNVALYNL